MPKVLVWTDLAIVDLENTIKYFKEKWSEKVLQNFYFKLEALLIKIQKNPKQFPFLNKSRRYRKSVLTKQNSIFYKEFENEIVILRLFDNQSNPNKRLKV